MWHFSLLWHLRWAWSLPLFLPTLSLQISCFFLETQCFIPPKDRPGTFTIQLAESSADNNTQSPVWAPQKVVLQTSLCTAASLFFLWSQSKSWGNNMICPRLPFISRMARRSQVTHFYWFRLKIPLTIWTFPTIIHCFYLFWAKGRVGIFSVLFLLGNTKKKKKEYSLR